MLEPISKSLDSLIISGNLLTNIGHDVLASLQSLRFLDMSDNRIGEIHPDALAGLQYLSVVYLNNNRLVSLPDKMFGSKEIQSLSLADNYINIFPKSVLQLSSSLINLDLSFNELNTLPGYLLCSFGYLEIVNVVGNKLECQCDLVAFNLCPWVNVQGQCHSPEAVMGMYISEVTLTEECREKVKQKKEEEMKKNKEEATKLEKGNKDDNNEDVEKVMLKPVSENNTDNATKENVDDSNDTDWGNNVNSIPAPATVQYNEASWVDDIVDPEVVIAADDNKAHEKNEPDQSNEKIELNKLPTSLDTKDVESKESQDKSEKDQLDESEKASKGADESKVTQYEIENGNHKDQKNLQHGNSTRTDDKESDKNTTSKDNLEILTEKEKKLNDAEKDEEGINAKYTHNQLANKTKENEDEEKEKNRRYILALSSGISVGFFVLGMITLYVVRRQLQKGTYKPAPESDSHEAYDFDPLEDDIEFPTFRGDNNTVPKATLAEFVEDSKGFDAEIAPSGDQVENEPMLRNKSRRTASEARIGRQTR